MTGWLITHFIKNHEDAADPMVRHQYANLAGRTGIFVNLLLFSVKLAVGMVSGSVAVVSDAVNNLSDAGASLVSLLASRISARSADQEHPYGHGRMEYIAALVMAGIIFSAAYELFSDSVRRILHPLPVESSVPMIAVLFGTVLVKLWMSGFYQTIGTRIGHAAILASAADAKNDVIATSLTILTMILSLFNLGIPVDGIAGTLLSGYLFYSGCGIAREIVSKLLGEEGNEELRKRIEDIIAEEKGILGSHDLLLHDYGPEHCLGSVHCELPENISLLEAHERIDGIEQRVKQELGVDLTVHPDPVGNDELSIQWKKKTEQALETIRPDLSMHDFHLRKEGETLQISFDLSCPFDQSLSDRTILEEIRRLLKEEGQPISCKITFDHGGLSHTEEIHEPAAQ